ncbi:TIR domain-containing protein [Geomonas sp. Red32]|uniref:TIR domain-containing protein n=1 Tax=Geomonas sp. Red32 TaxID=2912856 RepID=UPI00202D0C63|nr:TIR domain-containing protein [Geomonas sp. Red32]MCM0080576.1 TIR domain-containing protein [Geomonas sp. Red32]
MALLHQPPISVNFIWHPSDNELVRPILALALNALSRDLSKPFSRNLNIPLFFYSSDIPTITPNEHPGDYAERNVIFVFTSVNTSGRKNWDDYIGSIPLSAGTRIVPIALSPDGLGHCTDGSLKDLNFIRVYQWPATSMAQQSVLAMAHEIYRHGFVTIGGDNPGNTSSVKVFLSHSKSGDTGRIHAETIKAFIENTNMSHFFDATTISPGFKFNEEIITHIKESTMVAICSDEYSSRYWCQREILCAKEQQRPMIVVNCLEDYEDRIFPASSNVPCVRVLPKSPLSESAILKILTAALLETIRHCHAMASLQFYKNNGWIDPHCELSSRPPEIRQLLAMKRAGETKSLCYPEPPIYFEEAEWHRQLEVETFTPLWSSSEGSALYGMRVGIYISEVAADGFKCLHIDPTQLIRLAQDIARHLLGRSATIIYGGDLRNDGFTEFILDEAIVLKNRLNTDEIHVENHLAWPLYKTDELVIAWRSKYRQVMETVEHDVPDDVEGNIDKNIPLEPNTPQNKYIWSRCLTEMRIKSIESCHACVCAGGKLSGYNGKMAGVLEEILIALEKKKPIYLLGAFGGVVGEVCKVLQREAYPEPLTEAWHVQHNAEYELLQIIAAENNNHADYQQIKSILRGIDVSSLCNNAGIDEAEYFRLMKSPFVDECIHLIMQGLTNLANGGANGPN